MHIMAKASMCSKTMMALGPYLHALLAMQHNVHIHIQHIAGVSNDAADTLLML